MPREPKHPSRPGLSKLFAQPNQDEPPPTIVSSIVAADRERSGRSGRREDKASGSAVAQATSSEDSSEDFSPTNAPSAGEEAGAGPRTEAASAAASHADPMERAMLEILARTYPKKIMSDAMHVTSIKVPKNIWTRLETVKAVTGRNQQELIAIALTLLFEEVRGGKRFDEWEEELSRG